MRTRVLNLFELAEPIGQRPVAVDEQLLERPHVGGALELGRELAAWNEPDRMVFGVGEEVMANAAARRRPPLPEVLGVDVVTPVDSRVPRGKYPCGGGRGPVNQLPPAPRPRA